MSRRKGISLRPILRCAAAKDPCSEFTVTLLIQAADTGGAFEYRSNLRTEFDPHFNGVATLLRGEDRSIRVNPLAAGSGDA